MFCVRGCRATSKNGDREGISPSLWWWLGAATLLHPRQAGTCRSSTGGCLLSPKKEHLAWGGRFFWTQEGFLKGWGGWARCLPAPAARLKQASSGELCAEALRLLWHREPQMGFKGHKRETEQKDTTEGLNEIVSNDPEPSSKILW